MLILSPRKGSKNIRASAVAATNIRKRVPVGDEVINLRDGAVKKAIGIETRIA